MTVMGRPASPADSLPMTDAIPQVMIVPYLNVSFAENEQVNGHNGLSTPSTRRETCARLLPRVAEVDL